ncbi:MFS transporter [Serratia ficaria]|uniref:MFS transporter n=1 Tax=Serratia ficaria TaxID=61651 RepID=UPI002ED165A8|nr:MFS transporter [Serratia ficaria]
MFKVPMSVMTIAVLAATAFAAGLSEFIVIGLLGQMADEFEVSLSQIGLLVTAYALGITLGAPLLTLITLTLRARPLVAALMLLFAMVSVASPLASSFGVLLALRAIAGALHGAYFSIVTASLSTIFDPRRTPMVIALMFSGLTLAIVLGVPAGMLAAADYGWQAPFMLIAVVASIGGVLLWFVLPEHFGPAERVARRLPLLREILTNPALIRPYCFTVLAFGGGFVFFSYAEPWLSNIAALDTQAVAIILGAVGLGSLAGNIIGGVLPAITGLQTALIVALSLQCAGLVGMFWTGAMFSPVAFLLLWSIGAFATAPMVQNWAIAGVDKAHVRLSASLNVSAFNLGLSLSSFIATRQVMLDGMAYLPVTAAVMVALALPFCFSRKRGLLAT